MEVFIIAAMTADGFIGRDDAHKSTNWTSKADKQFFIQKTKEAGALVMGRKTYETIGRPLPNRLNIVYTSKPDTIEQSDNLLATDKSPQELINSLSHSPINSFQPQADRPMAETSQQYTSLAICGGASIYRLFMESGLVTKLYLTIEPVLFGTGIKLFDKQMEKQLHLEHIHKLSEETVVLEYSIKV